MILAKQMQNIINLASAPSRIVEHYNKENDFHALAFKRN